jgi:exosortase A
MNAETDRVLRMHEPIGVSGMADAGWRVALPLTVAVIAVILAVYWGTAASIVAIWWRSETFAHGFLIVPISIVLIWMKRREVAKLTPAPDALGLVMLAGAGLAWLVAWAGQVQVVQQYAMTAMIPAAVVAVAGRRVALALAFPLAFLLLGVPAGEVLIPPLMDWTAHFTVVALRLTGIPVFQQGTYFTIPSGSWSVVEGCSGLRYLIASVTVGVLYAYLSYKRLWKRLLFVALSVVVPIIANGLRAYMIVMIADLSDMKLALGIDHIIYGWVFFGIVIFVLFWAGSFWRDPAPGESRETGAVLPRVPRPSSARIAGAAVAAVALAVAWPLWAAHLDRASQASANPVLAQPSGASGWKLDAAPLTGWRPRYSGASTSLFDVYRKGDQAVALYVGYYAHPRRGAELVTTTNVMVVQKDPVWHQIGQTARSRNLGKGPVEVRETRLQSTGQRLLIWDWFRIAGRDLSNPYLAKLLLARGKLLGRGAGGAAIILATPYDERPGGAEHTLQEFTREMLPSIDATLARVESQ